MLKMGDSLDLEMVGIRTYKGNIVNIYLFFKRPESYKILSDFLTAYGNYTDKPDEYKDIYNWNSSAVSLSLMYEAKVDLGVAVFTCNRLSATVAANDKLRSSKIESLALSALPFSMPQTAGLGSK
jgi:hypothetical protein